MGDLPVIGDKQVIEAIVDNSKSSAWLSKIAIGLSALALLFSIVATIFSYADYCSDLRWQNTQLETLKEIARNTKTISP